MYGLEKNIILTYLIFCDRKAAIDANVFNSGSESGWIPKARVNTWYTT